MHSLVVGAPKKNARLNSYSKLIERFILMKDYGLKCAFFCNYYLKFLNFE